PDIVLPATMFLEHDDFYTASGHTYFQVAKKVIEAPGECRENHYVISELARRLGATHRGFAMTAWEIMDATLRKSGMWDAETNWRRGGQDCALPFQTAHFLDGFPTPARRVHFKGAWRPFDRRWQEMPVLPDHFDVIDRATPERPFRLVAAPARGFLNSTFSDTASSRARARPPAGSSTHPSRRRRPPSRASAAPPRCSIRTIARRWAWPTATWWSWPTRAARCSSTPRPRGASSAAWWSWRGSGRTAASRALSASTPSPAPSPAGRRAGPSFTTQPCRCGKPNRRAVDASAGGGGQGSRRRADLASGGRPARRLRRCAAPRPPPDHLPAPRQRRAGSPRRATAAFRWDSDDWPDNRTPRHRGDFGGNRRR